MVGIFHVLALKRSLESPLCIFKPKDPVMFVVVSLVLIAVALIESRIPSSRASKVDPMVALRYE